MAVIEVKTMVDRFVRFLETAEDTDELLDPQVFVDFNVPHWRFQTQGAETLAGQLKDDAPNGATVTTGRSLATPTGFVLEAEHIQDDQHGDDTRYRTMWAVETRDGRIAEIVVYCTGEWDKATQARQAAEAPMIRPNKG